MSTIVQNMKLDLPELDFKQIYETFRERVYKVAIRITRDAHLAEDIMQETFLKAYKKIGTIADFDKIGAWLSTIASRTAIDLIRKEKRAGVIPVEDIVYAQDDALMDSYVDVEKEAEQHWLEEEIEQGIEQLNPELRDVFLLKYHQGYKEEEIAERLQLPKGTVKSRLYRARQQLKVNMQEQTEAMSA